MQLPTTALDDSRRRDLRTMRRWATGLLVLVALIYAVAFAYEPQFAWLGYVRAFAEAAMIGALADWFAVTALFRHPLGVPIPHTAIVARRKDALGASVGRFVQENFLAPDVLVSRLRSVQVVDRVVQLVAREEVRRLVARQVTALISGALDLVNDDEVQQLVQRSVTAQARNIQPSPLLGRVLAAVLRGERLRELVDEMTHLSAQLLEENKDMIRDRIRRETPWWMPSAVDKAIAERIFSAIDSAIQEINADPNHPFYERFSAVLANFIERLQHDPETIARGEAIKQDVLESRIMRDFSAALWFDLKGFLRDQSTRSDSALQEAIQQSIGRFGTMLQNDPALASKIERLIEKIVIYLSQEYRGQFANLVSYTVSRWDTNSTVDKIELLVGKDLQYIRINGTLVGGMAGLLIYTVSHLLR